LEEGGDFMIWNTLKEENKDQQEFIFQGRAVFQPESCPEGELIDQEEYFFKANIVLQTEPPIERVPEYAPEVIERELEQPKREDLTWMYRERVP
jgi:hypothetical protein